MSDKYDPPPDLSHLIEDTRGLASGVTVSEEMLCSIAISLKRIADSLGTPKSAEHWQPLEPRIACDNCGSVSHETAKCPEPLEIPF